MVRKIFMVTLTLGLWAGLTISSEHTGPNNVYVLPDINPDPNIVEVNLEARSSTHSFEKNCGVGCMAKPCAQTEIWTYNGVLPGPQIEAEVGQTVVVNFTNNLPDNTTVHWHGMEVPAKMDGSHLAQLVVPPTGKFRYEFKALRASTYWYHPHVRSNKQIERGMAGTLVIRDPNEDTIHNLPPEYTTLVLDDVLTDEKGIIIEPFPADPAYNAQIQLNGRDGNLLLVNGKDSPTFFVYPNEPQRFRIVNVSNTRFFRLSIPGHQIFQIGSDGGLLEETVIYDEINQVPHPFDPNLTISNPNPDVGLMLGTGERADVLIVPQGNVGDIINVEWHDYHRGKVVGTYDANNNIVISDDVDDGLHAPQIIMKLQVVENLNPSNLAVPTVLANLNRIPTTGAALPVTLGHSEPDASGNVTFFAHPSMLPFNEITSANALSVVVGQNRVWEVENRTTTDHPFHTHGWFFQPIETIVKDASGKVVSTTPWPRLENKDTIRVAARPGTEGSSTTVRMAVLFDDVGREGLVAASGKLPTIDTSGGWLYHCHVLEHISRGMMSFLNITY